MCVISFKLQNLAQSLVIIPTYNEIENIEDIIGAVGELGDHFHVLVVDDNSPDGTAARVKEIQNKNDKLHLLERPGKLGLGSAYIAGFKYGLEKGFDYLFEMDADFSHDPKDLSRLLEACKAPDIDVTVGSRYVKGGGIQNWGKDRLILSYGASIYVRLISGMRIKDPTAGFICYSRKVLSTIDLDKIQLVGYGFQIEMKYAAYLNNFVVKEVPIIFKDREKGVSKMSSNIIFEAIWGVVKMRIKGMGSYYKKQ